MSAVVKGIKLLWKAVEMSDNARLAKQIPASGVEQITDIPYCESRHPLNMLDVYFPEGIPSGAALPVVIDIHGGGWYYGTKELNKNYCLSIAKRGFTVFNISYRLVPEVTMDEQLRDVMLALKWINEHLNDYPCDKNKILLTGDSAGGQLACFAAALCGCETLRAVYGSVDPEIKLTALGLTSPAAYLSPEPGIMGINAKTVLGKGYEKKAFSKFIDADKLLEIAKLPPTFLVTSSGDFIARSLTVRLYRDIEAHSGTAYIMDWRKSRGKNLPHVFSVTQPDEPESIKTTDEMLAYFLRQAEKSNKEGATI